MASIRKKGRSFEVRIKVSGVSKSKTFATLQECRTWARFAETELSDELKLTNHPGSLLTLLTLAQALTRYSIEVLPSLKGAAQERYCCLHEYSFVSDLQMDNRRLVTR
jgi:hypothetical protein